MRSDAVRHLSAILAVAVLATMPARFGGTGAALAEDGRTDGLSGSYERFYVDSGATGDDNGSSWEDAFRSLQEAIDTAEDSNASLRELWVGGGPYQPDTGFVVAESIRLYGGFAGGETQLDQRNWATHPTTIRPAHNNDEPALTLNGPGSLPVVDGFAFTGLGIGSEPAAPMILASKGRPTLRNLDIGGYIRKSMTPVFYVAGMQIGTDATVTHVRFRTVSATGEYGIGGIYVTAGDVELDGVGFYQVFPASVLVRNGVVDARNVTITPPGNMAGPGIGMRAVGGELRVTNVTIGEISTGIRASGSAEVVIRNSIVWSLTEQAATEDDATVTMSYTLVRNGCPDDDGVTCNQGMLQSNPLLVPYTPLTPGPVVRRLGPTSPAIDAGTDVNCRETDALGTPRPVDGDVDQVATCDLGAFEFFPSPPQVGFTGATSSVVETNGAPSITLHLSKAYVAPVTVEFTVTGTATPAVDHTLPASGSFTIPAYTTELPVDVAPIGDTIDEPNETLVLTLSDPTNAALGDIVQHTLTILDDDFTGTCEGKSTTISGTPGNDFINGTAGADVIAGLSGNDTINGLGGNDIICGGPGGDILAGGQGNDRLFGQGGFDRLRGGPGKDRLLGGGANDIVLGGPGPDQAFGGPGTDRVVGEGGADFLRGNAGNDRLEGGTFSDQLFGDLGNDNLTGGPGVADRCAGGPGVDSRPLHHGCEITIGFP